MVIIERSDSFPKAYRILKEAILNSGNSWITMFFLQNNV
jgi:hypothetical protein